MGCRNNDLRNNIIVGKKKKMPWKMKNFPNVQMTFIKFHKQIQLYWNFYCSVSYRRCYSCGFRSSRKQDRSNRIVYQTNTITGNIQSQPKLYYDKSANRTSEWFSMMSHNLWLAFQRSFSKSCFKRQLHSNSPHTITKHMAKQCVFIQGSHIL